MPPKIKEKKDKKDTKDMKDKKDKKEKKKKKNVPEQVAPIQTQDSEASIQEKEVDLLTDLNEEFFTKATKTVQTLMERGRTYEASKIKKYSDLLYKVHRRYAEELKKNQELQPLIERAESKLRLALEITAHSEEAMQHLKETLGDAWRESDATLFREEQIQEKLQEVLLKCEHFESKEAEKQDDTAEFGHLAKYKNIILRERDRINGEVIDLEKRLQIQRFYSESLEYIIRSNEDNINKMTIQTKILEAEKASVDVKMRIYINNMEEQRDANNKLAAKVDVLSREVGELQNRLQIKSADFDRTKITADKLRSENSIQAKLITKYEDEITDLRKEVKESEEVIRSLRLEDKVKAHSITVLTNKYKKVAQDLSSVSSKFYSLNRTNNSLNEEVLRLKNQVNFLEKGMMIENKRYDELRRMKDNVTRERDNLRGDIVKLNNQIADLKHTIVMNVNTMDNLHMDVNRLNVKLDEAKVSVSKAERERSEISQEMETLHEKIEYFQEQIQLKTNHITDLAEAVQQKQFALINMKKQLEAVHSEKMILQRNLETCTQERDNFRVLQMKTSHQITQLTNEISANQNKINSLNLRIERLNNDKKDLQTDLKNKENMLTHVRRDLKEMKAKSEAFLKTISDDELKFMKLSTELDETRKEKNLIGLQMVRRNDEIILLKEKLSITQTALDQGQTQYNQRVEDIRLLKMEIINLQTERECLSRALKSTADMRGEIIRLQRLLNQERVKVRSLTEDAKIPTGVHRWRILKGEDPNKFQLLAKVQMLQRRNLKQEIEKVNIQQRLEESNKVCESLKRVIENLPSTNVKQKLVETQRINKQQLKKLKALNAELCIDKIELQARECIIEEFKTSLKITKQQCLAYKDGGGDRALLLQSDRSSDQDDNNKENFVDCVFTPIPLT